jgi:hypothetical protein
MYLSVSPHVEPTHTFYAADGQVLPPRYGVWREAGVATDTAPTDVPRAVLLEAYRSASRRLSELAASNAQAVAGSSTNDDLWHALRPVLQHIEEVERTWNALAIAES